MINSNDIVLVEGDLRLFSHELIDFAYKWCDYKSLDTQPFETLGFNALLRWIAHNTGFMFTKAYTGQEVFSLVGWAGESNKDRLDGLGMLATYPDQCHFFTTWERRITVDEEYTITVRSTGEFSRGHYSEVVEIKPNRIQIR